MIERFDLFPILVRQRNGVIGILRINPLDVKQPGRLGKSL
jgi:hypothetical protein